jgi:hypothetical protein
MVCYYIRRKYHAWFITITEENTTVCHYQKEIPWFITISEEIRWFIAISEGNTMVYHNIRRKYDGLSQYQKEMR